MCESVLPARALERRLPDVNREAPAPFGGARPALSLRPDGQGQSALAQEERALKNLKFERSFAEFSKLDGQDHHERGPATLGEVLNVLENGLGRPSPD